MPPSSPDEILKQTIDELSESGDDALTKVEDGLRPDIVVSDYRLPGRNGIEVVRCIRNFLGEEVPTILITGDTSAKDIAAANLACCTVIHKPISSDRLISLIHESCRPSPQSH